MLARLLCRLIGHLDYRNGVSRVVRANATTYITHYKCSRCGISWHEHEIFYRGSTEKAEKVG